MYIDGDEKQQTETTGGATAPAETAAPAPAPAATEQKKETIMKKPKSSKKKVATKPAPKKSAPKKTKKATKAAGPKKPRESVKYPACSKKNPYREKSTKAKAYDIFAKGGTRSDMLAAIVKLGATEATASAWVQRFRGYAAPGGKK